MARAKRYLDIDVVTAARERMGHIYDLFDSSVVMFSGGKDSLVCLNLAKEYHEKHGLGKVQAVFRHEEVINPSVLKYVEEFRHMDWLDLYWFCLPMGNGKFVLGQKDGYTEWDPNREWVGEQPEWAITNETLGLGKDAVFSQQTLDDLIANYLELKGKVAYITGVRASESLVRFRSVTQKLNENYINSIEGNTKSRVKLCKPIYDWQEKDVLKFLYEEEIGWCPVYDTQELAGVGLRVSTALHVVAAKKFHKMREMEPEFYQKIVDIFPDMMDQERYWHEFDKKGIIGRYSGRGYEGVEAFINDNIAEESRELALSRMNLWKGRAENDPENYPVELLLETIAFGIFKQRLAGKYVNSKGEKKRGRSNR